MEGYSDRAKFFILLFGVLALQAVVPWSNMAFWNLLDYRHMDMEDVREMSREITVKWQTTLELVDEEGKTVERKLTPGTKANVLAINYQLPDERYLLSYKPKAKYLIELENGARGLAVLPEAAKGLGVYHEVDGEKKLFTVTEVKKQAKPMANPLGGDSNYPYCYVLNDGEYELPFEPIYWPIRNRIPIYQCYDDEVLGDVTYFSAFASDLDDMMGDSLEVLESKYLTAKSVMVQKDKKIAYVPNINLYRDGKCSNGLILEFQNDTLAGYHSLGKSQVRPAFITRFLNIPVYTNPNLLSSGIYKAYPWGNVGSRYIPYWLAKAIHGLVDIIVYGLLCWLIIIFIRRTIFHVPFLPNWLIKWTSPLVALLIYKVFILLFAAYSVNVIYTYIFAFMVWVVISVDMECERCKYCHGVGCLEDLGESNHRRSTETDTFHGEEEVGQERHGNTVVHRMRKYTETEVTHKEYYTQTYRCKKCGKLIVRRDYRILSSQTFRS